ncbi:HlyD family secretion protein [Shewanella psychrotolerans]|uniref:HlyD family secretion protein n=1 Tax=Shewanella psychrotolerans TaxID=2864206 RepID=UPI001C6564C6|nr:HlyD family secretion protein [Shewanella psychrotolerans]QYK02998.1 HlyD family secretion protein [Shewanella psychrotolerans]
MTPDQQFTRLVKFAIVGFMLLFSYFLLADLQMPLTTQAMATRTITQVAPQISGRVIKVEVKNNQQVKQGDLLFSLDATPYELALEQAELSLEQARQDNAELDASIAAAEADVNASETNYALKQREAKRLQSLYANNSISQQMIDQAQTEVKASLSQLLAAKAQLAKIVTLRGEAGEGNLKLRQAKNNVEKAKLSLSYTKVRAEQDGVVTNLQLATGNMVNNGAAVMALVLGDVDVIADFREKSLRHVSPGTVAMVAFDGQPGQLYQASVTSVDAGVSNAQFAADGRLATPTESNRWVRDAQRFRLHLELDQPLMNSLPAGAKATVQLQPSNRFFSILATLQIKLISLLHFIY